LILPGPTIALASIELRRIDLAAETSRHGLYTMRDGRPIKTRQIHARAGDYPDMFERNGPFIRFRETWRTRD